MGHHGSKPHPTPSPLPHPNNTPQCIRWGVCRDLNVSSLQTGWTNIQTVLTPAEICADLQGTLQDNTCTLDFSQVESSGFLKFFDGVQTPDDLCGLIHGEYEATICYVTFEGIHNASEHNKEVACGKLNGE